MYQLTSKLTHGSVFRTAVIIAIFFFSCRKHDYYGQDVNQKQVSISRFLTLPVNVSEDIRLIAHDIRKREEKQPFLAKYISKNGYPVWNKTLSNRPVTAQTSARTQNDQNNSGLFMIPFQNESSNTISAYLVVFKRNDSMFQYGSYNKNYIENFNPQTDTVKKDGLNLLSVFGYFEKELNHVSSFSINGAYNVTFTDVDLQINELTGNSSSGRTANGAPSSDCNHVYQVTRVIQYTNGLSETVTFNVVIDGCVTPGSAGYPGDLNGGGFGGNWGGGGASSGGSGSGNGAPGTYWDDICQCMGLDPWWSSGGGGPQLSFEEIWFNSLPDYQVDTIGLINNPCAQGILNNLLSQQNSVIEAIKEIFNETTKFNITFEIDPSLNVAGKTTADPIYQRVNGQNGDLLYLNIKIRLDPDHLAMSTKLSIAETIIHEMIHSYFYYRSIDALGSPIKEQKLAEELGFLKVYDPNLPSPQYGTQHEQMASTFINKIADILKNYKSISSQDLQPMRNVFPAVDAETYYKALAWAGLAGSVNGDITKAWTTFKANNPQSVIDMYETIISAEENATVLSASKEKC